MIYIAICYAILMLTIAFLPEKYITLPSPKVPDNNSWYLRQMKWCKFNWRSKENG